MEGWVVGSEDLVMKVSDEVWEDKSTGFLEQYTGLAWRGVRYATPQRPSLSVVRSPTEAPSAAWVAWTRSPHHEHLRLAPTRSSGLVLGLAPSRSTPAGWLVESPTAGFRRRSFPKRCYDNPDFQSGFYPTICDHQHGYVVGRYMRIAKTIDGGASWLMQSNWLFDASLSGSTTLRAVVGLGENALSALAVGDRGFILFTTNGGASRDRVRTYTQLE
jgi:hypothetical protein